MKYLLIVPLFNRLLLGLCVCVFLLFVFLSLNQRNFKSVLKKNKQEEWQKDSSIEIGEAFHLEKINLTVSLTKISKELQYWGRNERPDAEERVAYFSIKGKESVYATIPGEKHYLSSGLEGLDVVLEPSEAFIELEHLKGSEGLVFQATLCDESKGKTQFVLKKEMLPPQLADYGNLQADTTLLCKQGCRWYGKDLFLNEHGGDLFLKFKKKEHLEFGESSEVYSCYLTHKEGLVWNGELWKECEIGVQSQNKPLLFLNKLDENTLQFELWDIKGNSHFPIVVVKCSEAFVHPLKFQELRLLKARTRKQYLVETPSGQLTISCLDWLLSQDGRWVPLKSKEAIEKYVEGKSKGELFVVERLIRQQGRPVLLAHTYNGARSIRESVQIGLEPKLFETVRNEEVNEEEQTVQDVIDELLSDFS